STGKEVHTIFTSKGGNIEEMGLRRDRQFRGAFALDGKAVVVGEAYRNFVDRPRRVRVFDLATGKETATLQGPEREIELVTFTPDGGVAAGWFAYDMARVRLWDLATKQPRTDLFLPSANINLRTLQDHFALAFPPDGKTVATMQMGALALWDVETALQRHHVPGEKAVLGALAFRVDSRPLAVALRENRLAWTSTVELWDARSEKRLLQLEDLPPGSARQVAWSGDGQSI